MLVAFVFLTPWFLGELTYYSFCRICPAAALQVGLPKMLMTSNYSFSTLTAVRLTFLALVLTLAVFSSRSFCKVFCPIGAMLAPLNRISFWFIRMPEDSCTACGKCDKVCSAQAQPSSLVERGLPPNRLADCIVCHECQDSCQTRSINN